MDSDHILTLPRGTCRMWRSVAGTELLALRGRLQIAEACRSVADHTVSRFATLESRQPHRVVSPGWITLTAVTDCELRVCAPAPTRRAGTWHALRRMITVLRSVLAVASARTL
jgi:hypothetical protein